MNSVFIYNKSRGLLVDQKDPILIQNALNEPDSLIWMDLEDPTDGEIDILTDIFQFHPLSIEDCIFPQNRPKIEEFENYIFLVVHGIQYKAENDNAIITQELNIFLGRNFLVTFHDSPLRNINMVKTRCREKSEVMTKGSDFLLHLVLDNLVDSYFPILNQMDTVIDKIEDTIFTNPSPDLLNDVFSLKRDLMAMRRVINPQREMIANLTRRDFPFIQGTTLVYFRDIHDHLVRMTDSIDTYREIMTNALDVYLSVTSNQMNSVMKTLTIITTIMMPGTLISGIYGMNFEYMPHLHWRYGPYIIFAAIICITSGMLYYFRKKNWI
jgi:magnesium transporter